MRKSKLQVTINGKTQITKSKQSLADAIHASEKGWPDGADFAVQDKDMWICLYEGKPTRHGDKWSDDGDCLYKLGFAHDKLSPNWHQTVLSREEYFSAYPEKAELMADADGWIVHDGAKCPVATGVAVDVKYRDGGTMLNLPANLPHHTRRTAAPCWWDRDGMAGDIIAYRLHQPAVDAELCESVTRSIPESEAKPTIEQLTSDYRNKLDYATRKQQEADEAKAAADAALGELERAGEALGLVLSVAGPEPELMIADWRDLRVGDEVELVIKQGGLAMVGEVGVISHAFGNGDFNVDFPSHRGYSVDHCDIKFIRRP